MGQEGGGRLREPRAIEPYLALQRARQALAESTMLGLVLTRLCSTVMSSPLLMAKASVDLIRKRFWAEGSRSYQDTSPEARYRAHHR